jgi:phosphoserine aminotransferase
MNLTFNLATPELEAEFVTESAEQGLIGLKGHRSVGGLRASLYNAMTIEGVAALQDFMIKFKERRK